MNIKRNIITAALLTAAVCLPAQNKSAGINLSIWKNICTQPHDSAQTTYFNIGLLSTMNRLNGASFNLLGSMVHGEMNGVQITGLANLAGNNTHGVQIAGISNINGNNSTGLSASGLVNIIGSNTRGVSIAGMTGISGNNLSGIMIGGLISLTGNTTSGIQLSGIANITGDSFQGVMISGLLNVAGENANGCQLAGLTNIAVSNLNGMQIGIFNYATKIHGLQIGLINIYGEEKKGVQLGLINAHPGTKIQMMIYSGSSSLSNIGVRFKNDLFYTILGIGSMSRGLNDKFSINASYRAGLSLPLCKKLSVSGDLGYQHIETCHNKSKTIPRRLYALQTRINLEYLLTRKFGIFATGGYGIRKYYQRSSTYDKGIIAEAGIILF